ncbi:MAG: hypothetical protein JWN74_2293 [Acidobacteriaceae bacterium]|nr:hypothetical protein [Acidobacteriaceae bacterium]
MDATAVIEKGFGARGYGPGERALTSGGLTVADVWKLADFALVMVITNQNLSDEERKDAVRQVEMLRSDLHHSYDDCDHRRSRTCPYPVGKP